VERAEPEKPKFAPENHYDVVVSSEVLEHVDDYRPLIENMYRTLKPGGQLIVTVPHDPTHWSVLDEHGGHFRRYTVGGIRSDLRNFANVQITVIGFPILRLLTLAYLTKMRLLGQRYVADEVWGRPSMQLAAAIIYPVIRLDDLFNFVARGDTLIATATKPLTTVGIDKRRCDQVAPAETPEARRRRTRPAARPRRCGAGSRFHTAISG
jgi:SAM-dependent methyltransferase